MSEEGSSFWITLTEKIIGLFLVVLSIVLFYFTATSVSVLTIATGIFAFLGVVVLIGGVFLMITKPPE
jgi:hypothetical protein